MEKNLTEFTRAGFSSWLAGELGKVLSRYEQERVNRMLPGLFGYHVAQIGYYQGGALHSASHIGHKVVLHLEEDGLRNADCGVLASADSLPFAADSIDVAIIPHVLEFTPTPYAALKEVERILIADGHLIIIGFNPWSIWGLWRWLPPWRDEPPWNGRFYHAARVKNWLAELDFEVLEVDRFLFRPPFKHVNMMRRLLFLEKLGKFCWPFFGGAYVMLARKRVTPLTPIKMRWRNQRKIIASGASTGPATMTDSNTASMADFTCISHLFQAKRRVSASPAGPVQGWS